MKIVIAGATGFIGTPLSESLIRQGHELVILTRRIPETASRSAKVRYQSWRPEDETSTVEEVGDCDAVINLAGESVAQKRWTKTQKEKILTSRVNATQILVRSIERASQKPKVLINASAVGYYGPRGDEVIGEDESCGRGFLAGTCKAWEAHAIRAEDFGLRVVRLRIGVVLGKGGGALQKMVLPFQMFLGGWLGSGNQWLSWIHLEDVVNLITFCLTNEAMKGPVNLTAPEPVTNRVFSRELAKALHRPCLAPVPPFALKLLMGDMATELLLAGQRVMPKRAVQSRFPFRFPKLLAAFRSIFHCLALLLIFANPVLAQSELPRYQRIPKFELVAENGNSFTNASLSGKVWIADFIFTRCQSMCPLLTGRMADLQASLTDSNVQLVSFSVDPEYDQPEVLRAYAKTYGAQSGKWFFLTGDKNEMFTLMALGFQLGVSDATPEDLAAGAEPVMHSNRFVLVDQKGYIRGYYDSSEPPELEELIQDALKLGEQ